MLVALYVGMITPGSVMTALVQYLWTESGGAQDRPPPAWPSNDFETASCFTRGGYQAVRGSCAREDRIGRPRRDGTRRIACASPNSTAIWL